MVPPGLTTASAFLSDLIRRDLGLMRFIDNKLSKLVVDWNRSCSMLVLDEANTLTSCFRLCSGVSGVILISGGSTIEFTREWLRELSAERVEDIDFTLDMVHRRSLT